MKDKIIKKYNMIKEDIEVNFSDWMKLKVINIESMPKSYEYKVCIIDNNGYKYCVTYHVIQNARRRGLQLHKFFRNNICTIDNIKNFLQISNKNFTLESTIVNTATEKLDWNCPIHGLFNTSWNCVKNGQGCPTCGQEKIADSKRNSYDYVKSKFEEKGFILLSTEYHNNQEKLEYICSIHKDKGIQSISFGSLLSSGCYYCGRESMILKQTKSHDKFIEEVYELYGNRYKVKSQYTKADNHILVYCNNCNEEFSIRASHLLDNHGCPNCIISLGEDRVKTILKNNNINFTQQYRFDDCRNKKALPFDFYLPEYMTCIEVQGKQHYESVEYFGGIKQFEIQKKTDQIKKDYCLNNNIKLIEIPYTQYKRIEEILIENKIV